MVTILDEFRQAAWRARWTGVDLILLDASHGYLIASFLSPLANRREDAYGGSLERRMRFPLEAFDAMREAWPAERAVAVRLTATDWMPGGLMPDDAVVVARGLAERGCALIEVTAGQTVAADRPDYRRLYLVPLADRIRNEAGIPVMVGGNLTSADDVNTILAAGRADLCLVDPRLYVPER